MNTATLARPRQIHRRMMLSDELQRTPFRLVKAGYSP
jgi:hypothetical protein